MIVMTCINMVVLVGILPTDVEIRNTRDGRTFAKIRVDTHEYVKDVATGKSRKITDQHTVFCHNPSFVSLMQDYGRAGRWVKVSGKLTTVDGQTAIVITPFRGDIGLMHTQNDEVGYEAAPVTAAPAPVASTTQTPQQQPPPARPTPAPQQRPTSTSGGPVPQRSPTPSPRPASTPSQGRQPAHPVSPNGRQGQVFQSRGTPDDDVFGAPESYQSSNNGSRHEEKFGDEDDEIPF